MLPGGRPPTRPPAGPSSSFGLALGDVAAARPPAGIAFRIALSCQPGRIVRWQPGTTTLVLRTIAGVTLVVAVFRCGEASVTSLRAHRLFTAVGAIQAG